MADILGEIFKDPSLAVAGDKASGFLRELSDSGLSSVDIQVVPVSDFLNETNRTISSAGQTIGAKIEGVVDRAIATMKGDDKASVEEEREKLMTDGIAFMKTNVINPPFQFNGTDDVRAAYTDSKGNTIRSGLGRVYSDYVRSHFPILAIEPGRQVFNKNILALLGVGDEKTTYIDGASYLKGEKTANIPNPFEFVKSAVQGTVGFLTGNGVSASKFADFVNDIGRYSDFFDSMILEVASYMGLIRDGGGLSDNNLSLLAVDPKNEAIQNTKAVDDYNRELAKLDAQIAEEERKASSTGVRNANLSGSDVDKLTSLKSQRESVLKNQPKVIANANVQANLKENLAVTFQNIADRNVVAVRPVRDAGAKYTFVGFDGKDLNLKSILGNRDPKKSFADSSTNYLPFVIQNDVTVSETFSNNIGEHPLASSVNSRAQESQREKEGGGVTSLITPSNAKEVLQKFATGALKTFATETAGIGGELGYAIAGNTRLQLPNVWEDSTYSRSYSLTFTFFSPYGDDLSIFENTMTPLIMLLAMSLPMKVGRQSYMTPFVVRCHCPGVMSVDYGMIESLTVTRGDEKNDFTHSRNIPRTVKVNMTIRDMMPNIAMSFDGGIFGILNASNTGFRNYLMNICGLGIREKRFIGQRWERFLKSAPAGIDQWVTKFINLDGIANNSLVKTFASVLSPPSRSIDKSII